MYIINLCTSLRDTDLQSKMSLVRSHEKHTALSANPVKVLSGPEITGQSTLEVTNVWIQ